MDIGFDFSFYGTSYSQFLKEPVDMPFLHHLNINWKMDILEACPFSTKLIYLAQFFKYFAILF